MPFPFTIKFTRKLNEFFAPKDYPIVFDFLNDYLLKKDAKNIVIKNNVLTFKVEYDSSNFNFTLTIDSAEITIIEKDGHVIVTYEIFSYINFFIYFAISLSAGIISKSIVFGCLVFFFAYGPNLLINFFVHRRRLNKITDGIAALMKQKEV